MIEVGPCQSMGGVVHLLIAGMQAFTAILVAWLTTRAKRRDREERRRNGDDSTA